MNWEAVGFVSGAIAVLAAMLSGFRWYERHRNKDHV